MGLGRSIKSGSSFPFFGPDSAAHILRMRHGFQMSWIDAEVDAANMIQFQTVWNRTDKYLVGCDMRQLIVELPIIPDPKTSRP